VCCRQFAAYNGIATKAPPITTMTLLATYRQAGYLFCFKINFVLQINFKQQTFSDKINPLTLSNDCPEERGRFELRVRLY